MWQGLASAVQFLTVFPCGKAQAFDPRKALPFFPICGLLIGAGLAVVDALAMHLWSPMTSSLVTLSVLSAVSGALHLDGLADTADGLYSRRPPADALAIMKDSRIGAMGAVLVVFCLLAKWTGLAGIENHRLLYLCLVPAYGRSAVLIGIRGLPYGRPDGGTGLGFFQAPVKITDFWGLALVVALSLILGPKTVVINLAFFLAVFGVIGFYRRKLGCITGDMLGAMIELSETLLFLVASTHWTM